MNNSYNINIIRNTNAPLWKLRGIILDYHNIIIILLPRRRLSSLTRHCHIERQYTYGRIKRRIVLYGRGGLTKRRVFYSFSLSSFVFL